MNKITISTNKFHYETGGCYNEYVFTRRGDFCAKRQNKGSFLWKTPEKITQKEEKV